MDATSYECSDFPKFNDYRIDNPSSNRALGIRNNMSVDLSPCQQKHDIECKYK